MSSHHHVMTGEPRSAMVEPTSNVSDEQLVAAFANTNFGVADHRRLLQASVFKKLVGYYCGHTITTIMEKLGLIGKNGRPTKKGRAFVAHAYSDEMKCSG